MKTGIIIMGGIGAAAAVVYLILNRKPQTNSPQNSIASEPTEIAPTAIQVVKQTLWKDRDGHIFELTSQEDKWGYLLKVDGSGNAKAVDVSLGPDGYVKIRNKVGENWTFRNGWQRLSGFAGPSGFGCTPNRLGSAYQLH